MRAKWPIFAILAAFLAFPMSSDSRAVNTRLIDGVLKKGVLDSQDLQIIDNFVEEAVKELVRTRNLSDIAAIRTAILSRQSNQAQYAEQFAESTHKYIPLALREASRLTPQEHRAIITANLLILIDGLKSLRLADMAIWKLNDENTVVRYWAVHCLTNPYIIKQLNSEETSTSKLALNIAEKLKDIVKNSQPEVIALMAQFTSGVDIKESEELLLQIADMRIKKYADWTVEYEILDKDILQSLSSKINTAGQGGPQATTSGNTAIARRFCQLYSYVIQRYIKGDAFLGDTQKNQLISVMLETEDKCITNLMGKTQTAIKRAIEQGNTAALLQEHDRLLGTETSAGQVSLELDFEYGSSGTAPVALPEPRRNEMPK